MWLNEGFASYVEYLGADDAESKWKVVRIPSQVMASKIGVMTIDDDSDQWSFSDQCLICLIIERPHCAE